MKDTDTDTQDPAEIDYATEPNPDQTDAQPEESPRERSKRKGSRKPVEETPVPDEKPEAEAEEVEIPDHVEVIGYDQFRLARMLRKLAPGASVRDGRLAVTTADSTGRKTEEPLDEAYLKNIARKFRLEQRALRLAEEAQAKKKKVEGEAEPPVVPRFQVDVRDFKRSWAKELLESTVLRRVLPHEISWHPEHLSRAMRNLGKAMASRRFYSRSNCICRLIKDDQGKEHLSPLGEAKLRNDLAENEILIGSYKKKSSGKGDEKEEWHEFTAEDVTKDRAVRLLVSEKLREELPQIVHFNRVRLPFVVDGQLVLSRKGYDYRTKTLTLGEVDFDERMPLDQAQKLWRGLLKDFPLFRPSDVATVVGYAAALFASRTLPNDSLIPGFLAEANCRGAGKSALARLVCVAPEGILPTNPASTREEEIRKAVFSAIRSGAEFLFLDNLNRKVTSGALAAAMTSTNHTSRVLGESRDESFGQRVVVVMTGIQTRLSAELHRRILTVRLHAKEEKPEQRVLEMDLNPSGLKNLRPAIAASLWTFLRLWWEAGQKEASGVFAADYRDWHRLAGGISEFAGFGPIDTSDDEVDDETSDTRSLLGALAENASESSGWYNTASIISLAKEMGLFGPMFEAARASAKAEENAMTRLLTQWVDRRLGNHTLLMRKFRPRLWKVNAGLPYVGPKKAS